jgi:hypothetical protein
MRLTDAELKDYTGYKTPAKQVEWVRAHLKLDPPVGADGRPRLTWAVIEQATLARRTMPAEGVPIAAATTGVSSNPRPKWKKAA